jgi:hypothetical protein
MPIAKPAATTAHPPKPPKPPVAVKAEMATPDAGTDAGTAAATATASPRAPKGPSLVWTTGHTKGVPLTSESAVSKDGALTAIARETAAAGDGRLRVAEILSTVQVHPLFAQDHAAGIVTAAKVSGRLSRLRKAGTRLPPVGRVRDKLTEAVVGALNEGAPEYPEAESTEAGAGDEGAAGAAE